MIPPLGPGRDSFVPEVRGGEVVLDRRGIRRRAPHDDVLPSCDDEDIAIRRQAEESARGHQAESASRNLAARDSHQKARGHGEGHANGTHDIDASGQPQAKARCPIGPRALIAVEDRGGEPRGRPKREEDGQGIDFDAGGRLPQGGVHSDECDAGRHEPHVAGRAVGSRPNERFGEARRGDDG